MEEIQVLSEQEHVLLRTAMYLGSKEVETQDVYIVDREGGFLRKPVEISPAFFKIFEEVLNNATDRRILFVEDPASVRVRCTTIKVDVDREAGFIQVTNDGDGLPVRKHTEHTESWVPELLFGRLRTGSNFDDTQRRCRSGTNGVGASLTNIFSKRFCVESVDAEAKMKYEQEWCDNMTVVNPPKVTKLRTKEPKPYTRVRFYPDFGQFGMRDGLSEDVVGIMRKRTHDVAALGPPGSKTYFDGKRITVDTFQKYTKLYLPNGERVIYEQPHDRWRVAIAFTPDQGFRQVSFVNCLSMVQGGTHVDYVLDQVVKPLQAILQKKLPEHKITPSMIREHITLFVDCLIENASYESQAKLELKTKAKDWGSVGKLSKDFIERFSKSGIIKHLSDEVTGRAKEVLLKATDGKKTQRVRGIPKLEDAPLAGTSESKSCILVLAEGDSAKSTVVAAISALPSDLRKRFGVFPLRGKLLNVREASVHKLEGNAEVAAIKKILGLQQGKQYDSLDDLRYGKCLLMTDQDVDGSHIKGLLINFFHAFWPRLIGHEYICCVATPIIRATPKAGGQLLEFYNQSDYEDWKSSGGVDVSKWKIKTYKGLGTSTREEAKSYFQDVFQKLITYHDGDGAADLSIPLAFEKSKADARKEWLLGYDSKNIIKASQRKVSVSEFIHQELIHFSADDVRRSIPSLVDGLTPSRRKVLWTCFKKKLLTPNQEVRVSQLAGAVSELSLYHHGEASLTQTIVRLAQTFVGSNNINLLVPSGQFGTRLLGGQDAASPRYIMTYLNKVTQSIFNSGDEGILRYVDDDGVVVEPAVYLPVVPLVLVNGGEGIGTGWSSYVPPHNWEDVVDNLRNRLRNTSYVFKSMAPWFRGFKGSVLPLENGNFSVRGVFSIHGNQVRITELPVGQWTTSFKEKVLEPLVESKVVDKYLENLSDVDVDITVYFKSPVSEEEAERLLRLVDTIHMSNMHLFPPEKEHVKKYGSSVEILEEFYRYRLSKYQERKAFLLLVKAFERDVLRWRVQFIGDKMSGRIRLEQRTFDQVIHDLGTLGYPVFGSTWDDPDKSYKYITNTNIFALTTDKRAHLEGEYAKKVAEYENLERTSIQDMWLDDLNRFEAVV